MNLQQISQITLGAVEIKQQADGIHFYRFTEQQQELYKRLKEEFYNKSFSSAGVRMHFRTNSDSLFLKVQTGYGSSRSYFAIDVFVNGEKLDDLNNYSGLDTNRNYTKDSFAYGEFSKEFSLGKGEKTVCIYFPWSVEIVLQQMSLDDGAIIAPVKPKKKLLCFGDSITQGYDALSPSNRYASKLADFLEAEEYNKAIGGEVFFPALAATKEDFVPDYITVAYGTNDWNRCTKEEFICNCRDFFSNLHKNYPNVRTLVITPIWRKEMCEDRSFGSFSDVEKILQTHTASFGNISVIRGFEFVPTDEKLFADQRLHPNDAGFEFYFNNLVKDLKANKLFV
ncbi:MAG: SGNH/GDSL hydrolase family protein [Oscillospiraceae bacterium]|nr:SGNH/GDSL hydrolase family protein [Oscillospiraceae bacterium]